MNPVSKPIKPQSPSDSTVIKKTISLPTKTFRRAEKAAAKANRNFSNYIATLIAGDDGK